MPQGPEAAGAPPTTGHARGAWVWRLVILGVLAAVFVGAIVATAAADNGCTLLEKGAPYLLIAGVLLFLAAFYPLQRWCGLDGEPATGNLKELACLLLLEAVALAYFIPTVFGTSQRGKQLRTLQDMRRIAAGIEAFAARENRYPDAGTIDELLPLLEPTYIRTMPRQDGWRGELRIWSTPESYTILTCGKGCELDYDDLSQYPPGPTQGFTKDILFSNGRFVVYPEGSQTDP